MASLQKTYSGDLTTSIARQLWFARNVAAAAKEDAVGVAEGYGIDPMFLPGEFMGRALQVQATRMLPERFQRQMPSVTMGDPSYLARGQGIVDPLMGLGKVGEGQTPLSPEKVLKLRNLPEYQKLASPEERKFKGTTANTQVANKPTTNTSKTTKGVKVTDEKLGNFLSAVSLSLSATIDSMSNKLNESDNILIKVKDGITNVHKQLENSGDTLEEKLDSIISALRDQNNFSFKRKKKDDAKIEELQTEQENIDNGTNQIRKTFENDDEYERRQAADDEEERTRQFLQLNQVQGINQINIPDPWSDAKQLERGGIISGPDSGYPVILHGDEAVIPLDNNFTQREPSAIDGRISSPRPQSTIVNNFSQIDQQVEKGTPSMQKFGLNFFNSAVNIDRTEQKKASDKIYDIVTRPIATIGSTVTNLLQNTFGGIGTNFFSSLINGVSSLFQTENSVRTIQNSTSSNSSQSNNDNTNVSNNSETSESIASSDGGHTPFTHSGAVPTMLSSTVNNSQTSVLSQWWNKGRNMRVPNESSASWKTLMSDDMKQITKTNKAFKEGAKGIKGWRPLKAFTPKMFSTGPTPAVRQAIERPLGALAGGSKILGKGVAGGLGGFIMDMIFPEPINTYDQVTGPNAFYNNPSLTEEQRNFYMKSIHSDSGGTDLQVKSAEQSKENALGSLDQNIINSEPIVINNSSNTQSIEQEPIDHIATAGDPGLDQFYPSPY